MNNIQEPNCYLLLTPVFSMPRFYISEYEYVPDNKRQKMAIEESDTESEYSESDCESLIYCEPGRSLLPPAPISKDIQKMLYTPHSQDITNAKERYLFGDYEFIIEPSEQYTTCHTYRFWGTGMVSSSQYKTIQGVNRKNYTIGLSNAKITVYLYDDIERWIQETVDSPVFDKTPMYLMRHKQTGQHVLRDLSYRCRPDILLSTIG